LVIKIRREKLGFLLKIHVFLSDRILNLRKEKQNNPTCLSTSEPNPLVDIYDFGLSKQQLIALPNKNQADVRSPASQASYFFRITKKSGGILKKRKLIEYKRTTSHRSSRNLYQFQESDTSFLSNHEVPRSIYIRGNHSSPNITPISLR
jgi:hypothetical protein